MRKFDSIIGNWPYVDVRVIAEVLNIGHGSTQRNLVDVLGMKHFNGRLVPKELDFFQKLVRVEVAKAEDIYGRYFI